MKHTVPVIVAAGCLALSPDAKALDVTFASGTANEFTMNFVEIGNPGNADDPNAWSYPSGGVGYSFLMGTYEVSQGMISAANAAGGLGITLDTGAGAGDNLAAGGTTWYEAATFVNWLNTSLGYSPAYKYDGGAGAFVVWDVADAGYDANNIYRNSEAKFFIPSTDEWYKAAYYDPNKDGTGGYWTYPTGSDVVPTQVPNGTDPGTAVYGYTSSGPVAPIDQAGGLSPYGTMGQGGNVIEWNESASDGSNDTISESRVLRGSSFQDGANFLNRDLSAAFGPGGLDGNQNVGFRVATIVPEPSQGLLVLTGLCGLFLSWRRRR